MAVMAYVPHPINGLPPLLEWTSPMLVSAIQMLATVDTLVWIRSMLVRHVPDTLFRFWSLEISVFSRLHPSHKRLIILYFANPTFPQARILSNSLVMEYHEC